MNAYPPAPWHLRGRSVQSLKFVPVEKVRALVPHALRILQLLPGKTLAVMYCARYESASSLQYSELALAPALVWINGKAGFWISHIYVDNPASVAGGRDIWRLPKRLATFSWSEDGQEVAVNDSGQTLCRIQWTAGSASFPLPALVPVVTETASGYGTFHVGGRGLLALRRAIMAVGTPFAELGFEAATALLTTEHLKLRIPAPRP